MSNVRHLLTPTPPAILYHYTTPAGLLGIVNGKEIWASHTQYLNDQREFKHAIDVIGAEIKLMKDEPVYFAHHGLLDEMESVLEDSEIINVCVCSFSEIGDDLSQWRAYGGAAGFLIGFRGDFLRAISAYLNRYAPILKHKAFEGEREWRIISRPLANRRDEFQFRAGASMLIPFYKIPLHGDLHPFDIAEVVVGPTPNSRQSRRSLQSLLNKHGLRETKVRNTTAPFRNW